MPKEVEVGEIGDRFFGPARRDFTRSHETPETLNDLHVHEVRRMEVVLIAKEAGLDSPPKRCLQKQLQQGRCVDDDHAESRSSRMATAAGVFNVTRFRLWSLASISSRVGRAATRPISARR